MKSISDSQHQFDAFDPVTVHLRHRFTGETKIYHADCPLEAHLKYRPIRQLWVVERMIYQNDLTEVSEH